MEVIRVFFKFGTSTDCVRKPTDNFRTFVRALTHHWANP